LFSANQDFRAGSTCSYIGWVILYQLLRGFVDEPKEGMYLNSSPIGELEEGAYESGW